MVPPNIGSLHGRDYVSIGASPDGGRKSGARSFCSEENAQGSDSDERDCRRKVLPGVAQSWAVIGQSGSDSDLSCPGNYDSPEPRNCGPSSANFDTWQTRPTLALNRDNPWLEIDEPWPCSNRRFARTRPHSDNSASTATTVGPKSAKVGFRGMRVCAKSVLSKVV